MFKRLRRGKLEGHVEPGPRGKCRSSSCRWCHHRVVRCLTRWLSVMVIAISVFGCSTGQGHPSGWKAVDFQNVRFYVPAAWPVRANVQAQSLTCGGIGRVPPPAVLLVDPSQNLDGYACSLGSPASSRAEESGTVAMVVTNRVDPPASNASRWSSRTVHGLHIKVLAPDGLQAAGTTVLIGQRHVAMDVVASPALTERIVNTLR